MNTVSTKLYIAQNPENVNIAKVNVGGLDRKRERDIAEFAIEIQTKKIKDYASG